MQLKSSAERSKEGYLACFMRVLPHYTVASTGPRQPLFRDGCLDHRHVITGEINPGDDRRQGLVLYGTSEGRQVCILAPPERVRRDLARPTGINNNNNMIALRADQADDK